MSNCTKLSSLLLSVHGLPNVSNVGNGTVIVNSTDGNAVHLFTADPNSQIRSWFWGAFIVILTSAVLYATCFYYCCVCCCFCCEGTKRSKSRKLKLGCGLMNIMLIVCALGLVCVSVWYEVEVNRGIEEGYDSVLDFISVSNDSVRDIGGISELMTRIDYFERFEHYRYRVALGYLGFVLLMLVFSIIGITFAAALRTAAGTTVISVLIGLFAVIAFLMSMLAGASYTFLIYYSDLCLDLYAVGGNSLCSNPSFVSFIEPLHTLCNDVFMDTFLLVMFGCGLVVVFILLQIFSAVYAGSLTGKDSRQFETSEREIVISSPVMASGVWNSYGAKTVLGVKSHTQPITQRYPPPYPLDSVAPETPRGGVRRSRGDSTTAENGIRSQGRGYQDAAV